MDWRTNISQVLLEGKVGFRLSRGTFYELVVYSHFMVHIYASWVMVIDFGKSELFGNIASSHLDLGLFGNIALLLYMMLILF